MPVVWLETAGILCDRVKRHYLVLYPESVPGDDSPRRHQIHRSHRRCCLLDHLLAAGAAGVAAFLSSFLSALLTGAFLSSLTAGLGASALVTAGVATGAAGAALGASAAKAETANALAIRVAINFMIFPFWLAHRIVSVCTYNNALFDSLVDKLCKTL